MFVGVHFPALSSAGSHVSPPEGVWGACFEKSLTVEDWFRPHAMTIVEMRVRLSHPK
jgi:hypothetical protein